MVYAGLSFLFQEMLSFKLQVPTIFIRKKSKSNKGKWMVNLQEQSENIIINDFPFHEKTSKLNFLK